MWNWVKVSNVTPVQWCINVQSVFSKLHNGCNLLFTDTSQVWNISNSKKLFCLRNSDTLYCFLKLSKTASQTVQCCKRCKSRQPNKQYTTSFSETVHITKGTLHHQSHSCGLSTVWLCGTFSQNAKPPQPLMSSLLAPQSGALRRGAYRDFHTHLMPSTYSFWAFKPVYTKAFEHDAMQNKHYHRLPHIATDWLKCFCIYRLKCSSYKWMDGWMCKGVGWDGNGNLCKHLF